MKPLPFALREGGNYQAKHAAANVTRRRLMEGHYEPFLPRAMVGDHNTGTHWTPTERATPNPREDSYLRDLTLHGMSISGQNIVGGTGHPYYPHTYLEPPTLHDTFDTTYK